MKQIRKVQVKTLDLSILKNLVLEMPWDENEKLKLKLVRDDIEVWGNLMLSILHPDVIIIKGSDDKLYEVKAKRFLVW